MQHQPKSFGEMTEHGYLVRGVPLEQLAQTTDLVSAAWLIWTGEQPTPAQKTLLNACLVMCMDHGADSPAASASRLVASCGKPMADAVAAGLLTLGPRHGNAGSLAAQIFRQALEGHTDAENLVRMTLERGERIPGFGHPVYDVDPRAQALIKIAKQSLKATPHLDYAITIAEALHQIKNKPLPLNIDGVIGAIVADLGVPDILADVIFLWARTVGLVGHALEASNLSSYLRG